MGGREPMDSALYKNVGAPGLKLNVQLLVESSSRSSEITYSIGPWLSDRESSPMLA